MRAKSIIIAILLITLVAIPALGQDEGPPWDVRPYLSTYTDHDVAVGGDASWTWNATAVRHRFMCPYCGYSTDQADPDANGDYACPNPFGLTNHDPGDPFEYQLSEGTPRQRTLSELNVLSTDFDGDNEYPLMGRPFHPGGTEEPDWDDTASPWESPEPENVGSYLTLRAANLGVDPGGGALVDGDGNAGTSDGLRFLVVDPGSVRPAAQLAYYNSSDALLAPGSPQFNRSTVDTGSADAGADEYIIHVNPYRVSDGDTFYIWHHERCIPQGANFRTQDLDIEVYSTLYGEDFDSENIPPGRLNNYYNEEGAEIITNSGALRIEIPRQFSSTGEGWFVLKVEIQSNTTILPRHQAVNYDDVYGDDPYNDPTEEEPIFALPLSGNSANMPAWKETFVYADTSVTPVTIATADENDGQDYPVPLKDANGLETAEIWPYRMPPEAAGIGRVILQWSEATPETAMSMTIQNNPGAPDTYYFEGREWHYMVDPTDPDDRLLTNRAVANQTVLPDEAIFIDNYFMCSRLEVARTGDIWAGRDPAEAAEEDTEAATGGFARVILGEWQDPAGGPTGYVGQYKPGTRSPSREFDLANRMPVEALQCPIENGGCGARYYAGETVAGGDLAAGDPCPACSVITDAATGSAVALEAVGGQALVNYDGLQSLTAEVPEPSGNVDRQMTSDALQFAMSGALIAPGTADLPQQVLADIPPYQAPSVPAASATELYTNAIDSDFGYRGTVLAFNRTSDAADGDWSPNYVSPTTGNHYVTPEASVEADAQWVCSVCGSSYLQTGVTECFYCGNTFAVADDLPDPYVPYDALAASEFDPFGVQVSVLREPALAANQRVVDLGWVAPGTPEDAPNTVNLPADVVAGSEGTPTDVSDRAEMPARNEGNIGTYARMRATPLFQTGVDPTVRSDARWGQTVPITLGTLMRYRPGPAEFGDTTSWGLFSAEATGAAGQIATALLQAGIRSGSGVPYADQTKPVPLGQPVGNYNTDVLLYVDLDDDGNLDFYDAQTGQTNRPYWEYDPDVDEAFEPVAPFTTRARVVESRLPQSDFYSPDVTPTLLYDHDAADPTQSGLQVLWAGKRAAPASPGDDAPAGTLADDAPASTDPMNIFYSNAQVNDTVSNDPLYRGWLWAPPGDEPEQAAALSVSTSANEENSSPAAYVDEDTGTRWAMWHRSQTSGAGVSSQLRFDSSTDSEWDGSAADQYIFGSTGAHRGLNGFVREGAGNAHWLFWHAGPTGREHLRYRWEWDPTSGTVPSDERLMVTNSSTGQRVDFFEQLGQRYRKPALNPFTYIKQASAYEDTAPDGQFELNVLYTGHIRALGNSDICWSRFRFGSATDPDFPLNDAEDNFGKYPFPRVAGQLYGDTPYPGTDARNMPAVRDADGDIRGYVGEQLEPSPRRQSFQARDLDWLVTYDYQTAPDWDGWLTDGTDPGVETYDDPKFYVGVVTDDGSGAVQNVYAVDWGQGSYDPSTGLYTVMPRLVEMTDSGLAELPDAARPAVWHPYDDSASNEVYWRDIGGVMARALLAPSVRSEAMGELSGSGTNAWDSPGDAQPWQAVTLTINPASGMVQWSSPLFNPDNPSDTMAVFNDTNTPNIVDVVVYADYTPFIRRATTDRADDDTPSAFHNAGDSGRLTVFWRRSYGDTDTPHFGRPSFMHRSWTRSIQVGRPAIDSIRAVIDLTEDPTETATNVTYSVLSDANGVIEITPDPATSTTRIGHRIEVQYDDANGVPREEQHRVIGWSLETPIPVNTVTSEGPVRAIAETYEVDPDGSAGSGDEFDTVRYWLTWASPRGVYDMRPAADDGQQVHRSSDVYLAVVAPEHSSLIADLEVPRLEP